MTTQEKVEYCLVSDPLWDTRWNVFWRRKLMFKIVLYSCRREFNPCDQLELSFRSVN